jgi:hypothetical protein
MQRVPMVHRASASACPTTRPPGQPGPASPSDMCATDADCTKGTNGRCAGNIITPNVCSYDECATDADCGTARVCACRNPASYGANTCEHGDCRVDADCGPGSYCSPSGVTANQACLSSLGPGSIGYFCHTPQDTCVDDADCPQMPDTQICVFDGTKRWTCQPEMCPL